MDRAAQDRQRNRRRMALLFLLLPGALAIGIVSPQWVRVVGAQGADDLPTDRGSYQLVRGRKAPLVPPEFQPGFYGGAVDLNHLFSARDYTPTRGQLERIAAFEPTAGELIALDEVQEDLRDISFEDVLAAASVPSQVFAPEPFLPNTNPLPAGDGLRFDDFPTPGNGASEFTVPVPEPGTGVLVAAGLALLAARRRAV